MSETRNKRLKEVFNEARHKAPADQAAYLDEACGNDLTLKARAQALLKALEAATTFLEEPYGGATPAPENADPDDAMLGMQLGEFRIVRKIASGGMGTVYEAEQIPLNRTVALKVLPSHLSLSDTAILKFRREAEAGGRQHHPGIVSVYAVGEHKGIHYIAQELVEEGRTLYHALEEFRQREEQPPGYFRDVADLVEKVADAMEHAHESGVIHRDIKPSNILLTQEGIPKVTDFGLAKVEDALALSRTGDLTGTPYYMSPEQAMSRSAKIDRRTDIYSLGVTLYEVLTLKRPFEGQTSHEVLRQIVQADPEDPHRMNAKVPRDLSVICMKAMEKSPERRYQTMAAFSEDLFRFLHGDVILAKPAGLKTRFWKRVKRNPVVSASLGVALLSIVGFIGYELLWSIPQLRHERNVAKEERDKALIAEKKTAEQAQVIKENYERIIRLSDVKYLSELREDSENIWPAYPENIAKIEEWITRAEDLLGRLDVHQRTLVSLRLEALPLDTENKQPDLESWVFKDRSTQWWHDTLADLVSGLVGLADEEKGLVKKMKARLAFAETIEEKSIDDHLHAWEEAIASIRDREACPQYDGLVIEPQPGFVPLGCDADSGLWEFAHLQTGEIPRRGRDGELVLTEEAGLVFVLIPGGTFQMGAVRPSPGRKAGSPNVDPQAGPDENPVHEVRLKPFLISKYEMTQGQWLRFTGENRSSYNPARGTITLLHPVEQVNWNDGMEVLHRLKLRLPSESEWEYAARAGTTTVWWTGDEKESLRGAANLADMYLIRHGGNKEWAHDEWLDDGFAMHAPVGSLRPNAFGLHDVHGNVFEWCRDRADRFEKAPTDGNALDTGESSIRILRGGAWDRTALNSRSAMRRGEVPEFRSSDQGVRPAASLSDQ